MLYLIRHEVLKLKQDKTFTRNFCALFLLTMAFCLSLVAAQNNTTSTGKQAQIAQFSQKASVGIVFRTYQILYR